MAEEASTQSDDTQQADQATQPLTEEATQNTQATTEDANATNTEAKATEEGKGVDRGLLGETEKQEGAPEAYEDFAFPEGVEVSAEDQAALKQLAKDKGLTQHEAQKAAEYSRDVVKQLAEEQQAAEKEAMDKFRAENKATWESQPNHAERTLMASKAIKALGNDTESYFAEAGYLHDAKVLHVLAEMGKLMSEPTHVAGTETAPSGSGRIYNNTPEMYS
jgi:hypothetical protein